MSFTVCFSILRFQLSLTSVFWQCANNTCSCIVLGTVPDSLFQCGSRSEPNPCEIGDPGRQYTRTVAIWSVVPPTSRHFNFTTSAPTQYASSDHILIESIRRLCCISRSFTSHCLIYDRTDIRTVAIKKRPISALIWHYLTAIERIMLRIRNLIADGERATKTTQSM